MLSIVLPRECAVCGDVISSSREPICPLCLGSLPRTGHAFLPHSTTEDRFMHLPQVERAVGWLYYKPQTPSARLLEHIKYHHRPKLALYLGRLMARETMPSGMLTDVDAVVPVPLPPAKWLKRGYNQSSRLATGIAAELGVPVLHLLRALPHASQTSMSHEQRRKNVEGRYLLKRKHQLPNPAACRPLRLLLVDDVCTTGATLGACAYALLQAHPGLRLRIFTLGCTER